MNTPFSGQYLAAYKNAEGQTNYLKINVDPDRQGIGLAYLTSMESGNFAICDCMVGIDEAGAICGKAKRSERLEKAYDEKRTLSELDKQEVSFRIDRTGEVHRFTVLNGDKQHDFFLEPIGLPNRAEATQIASWGEFRAWANSIKAKDRQSIFRGVARSSYGLQTSFHRTGRVDLERYRDSDMPIFSDLAETVGGLRFDGDIGAMWGFAQHHGFPTPLLDWTESPYIAAYFAFAERMEKRDLDEQEKVRIYYLDGGFVSQNRPPTVWMADYFPRVWIFRPNSKGNQRLIFQQSLFLHSNVVEIEAYLLYWSKRQNVPVVSAIEMSAALAQEAMEELSYTGVNHLSLFPGLDGAAKYAAYKQFLRRN